MNDVFLIKVFTIIAVIQYIPLIAILAIDLNAATSNINWVFIGLTFVYVVMFVILVVKIRKVRDAFYIKKEYAGNAISLELICKALGIWLVLMIVFYIIIAFFGSGDSKEAGFDVYVPMLTYFGCL